MKALKPYYIMRLEDSNTTVLTDKGANYQRTFPDQNGKPVLCDCFNYKDKKTGEQMISATPVKAKKITRGK